MAHLIHLTLLGGALLEDEEGVIEGPASRRHPLAILALLATAPGGERSRGKLVGLLWPDAPEETARNRLSTAVYELRDALGEDALVSVGDDLRLDREEVRCDVHQFERAREAGELERAVELYEGPLLDGFRLEGSPAFGKWVDRERARFREDYRATLEALAEAAEERDEPAAAAGWWRERAHEDPYDGRVAHRLMQALARAGNPTEALRVARSHERRLQEELGAGPDEKLRTLAERIEAGELTAVREPSTVKEEGARGEPSLDEPGSAGAGRPGGSPDSEPEEGAGPDPDRQWIGSWSGRAGFVVLLVLLATTGGWCLTAGGGETSPSAGDRSVAVLPFEAVGAGRTDPLAEGLHTDLLTRLSTVPGLKVISATSVERFRDSDLTLPAIADSLGVRWVVEGDVQRSGGAIQVNAQLIDPRTDTHAWAETYRRELTAENLFEIQGGLVRRIAESLEGELGQGARDRLARRATGSLRAHRFYLRGRSLMEQREPEDLRRALAYFDQALAEDSSYALAWAGRANGLSHLARFPEADPDTLLPRADAAVERALALQPDLAEARLARGRLHMYRREGPAALAEMRRVVELKPSYAAAHAWLAKLRLSLGRPAEALSSARRSVELDPMSTENLGTLCWALIANGRTERALEVAGRVDELRASDHPPNYRILALAQERRREKLEAILRRVEEDLPDWARPPFWVAIHRPAVGDTTAATEALVNHEGRPFAKILLHGALGQTDRAFEVLMDAYPRSGRVWDYQFVVHLRYFWPAALDPLRADPRFDTFLAEMRRRWGLHPDGNLPDNAASAPVTAPTYDGGGTAVRRPPPPVPATRWRRRQKMRNSRGDTRSSSSSTVSSTASASSPVSSRSCCFCSSVSSIRMFFSSDILHPPVGEVGATAARRALPPGRLGARRLDAPTGYEGPGKGC